MKNLILFLLFVASCYSQESNFIINKGNLLWERVVFTDEQNIQALIAKHPRLKITSSGNNLYKGRASGIKNTCPDTSAYMENDLSFNFEIEADEGKYRITVSNIKFGKSKSIKSEVYMVKDSQVGQNNDTACLDAYFNRTFTMTTIYKNKP